MLSYMFDSYSEMTIKYDAELKALWCYFNPTGRPCFTMKALTEAKRFQQTVQQYVFSNRESKVQYLILASEVPGIFSLGGDLNLFIELIRRENRVDLLEYAMACIDVCYMNAISVGLPLTTISLVQGQALGGGFEAALSSNVLIAEKDTTFSFPEVRFNLFPGMGAYTFLSRRTGRHAAQKMMSGGATYSAQDLHEIDVVDILVDQGKGHEEVTKFIKKHRKSSNGLAAIEEVHRYHQPIEYSDLSRVAEIWVETAMRLSSRDLQLMEKLVSAQDRCIQN